MYIVFEYSLLALGLFFFGLIGFWKGIENTKKIREFFYESREAKEFWTDFCLDFSGRFCRIYIFLHGFALSS